MSLAILEIEAVRRRVLPVSLATYHAMAAAGEISEKSELLAGVVVEKMPKDPIHAGLLGSLFLLLQGVLKDRFIIRKEDPLTLGDSEPEPDLAIVDQEPRRYLDHHPRSAHLVVEVANTSLALDRAKAEIYARAGIREYWLIDLNACETVVYTEPAGSGYRLVRTIAAPEPLSPGCAPDFQVRLADLLSP